MCQYRSTCLYYSMCCLCDLYRYEHQNHYECSSKVVCIVYRYCNWYSLWADLWVSCVHSKSGNVHGPKFLLKWADQFFTSLNFCLNCKPLLILWQKKGKAVARGVLVLLVIFSVPHRLFVLAESFDLPDCNNVILCTGSLYFHDYLKITQNVKNVGSQNYQDLQCVLKSLVNWEKF